MNNKSKKNQLRPKEKDLINEFEQTENKTNDPVALKSIENIEGLIKQER